MRNWIQKCESDHQLCRYSSPTSLPQRLLLLGSSDTEPTVRLVEIGRDERAELGDSQFPDVTRYVCLSHCWGRKNIFGTESSTLQLRKQGIPFYSLPRTFQDAVRATLQLGIYYLWIDCLCIIQGDEQDWQVQSSQMSHIYKNAYLTICATRSSNCDKGLFHARRPNLDIVRRSATGESFTIHVREKVGHVEWSTSLAESCDMTTDFPLFRRAWCHQERLLSTRVLHYTANELVWDCKSCTNCECGTMASYNFSEKISQACALARVREPDGQLPATIQQSWRYTVQDYAPRNLTYQRDILPAISGTAKTMCCTELGKYAAGLWENDLKAGLLWNADARCKRPEIYTAPSWSWASVVGPVVWSLPTSDHSNIDIKVIDVSCTPKGQDSYGEVVAGYLRISGAAVVARIGRAGRRSNDAMAFSGPSTCLLSRNGIKSSFEPDDTDEVAVLEGQEVLCMRSYQEPREIFNSEPPYEWPEGTRYSPVYRFLVFICDQLQQSEHKRLGIGSVWNYEWFAGAEETEITVV